MRSQTLIIGLCAVILTSAPALAAKKKVRQPAQPSGQIACTEMGCHPVPRGCHPQTGYTWDGTPSGFDVVVCPGGITYGKSYPR